MKIIAIILACLPLFPTVSGAVQPAAWTIVLYHVKRLAFPSDKTGERYGRGAGPRILAGGKKIAAADILKQVTGKLR